MGIPSYFKRLIESVKGLLIANIQASTLLIDFNCIVYGCLRSETLPPFEGEDNWETLLNEEVCKYIVKIWEAVGKPARVHIAVDGVVPMAKIKQQRMRRFKSVWWAQKEIEMGVRKREAVRWDTNAITPGTLYMEKLSSRLKQQCQARGWTVSTSDEPGEGEHKIMEYLRSNHVEGPIIIYGLDADLILLSMLTSVKHLGETPVYLMREKAEFGKPNSTPFLFLSVNYLIDTLVDRDDKEAFIVDYIAVMSLLGNDFLPHSLTMKIRDGGHEELLMTLRQFRAAGKTFVLNGRICHDTFHELFSRFAESEGADLTEAIFKKRKTRPMNPKNDTERLMKPVQMLPVIWFAEKEFLEEGSLSSHWRTLYHRHTPPEATAAYLHGLQWIIDYYSGKAVNTLWFYPWTLPPTWADLVEADTESSLGETVSFDLKPQEQLAMVLPMESWHLVRDRQLRTIPIHFPQFWPYSFGFHTLGKTWMWECEANVPIILPTKLRSLT